MAHRLLALGFGLLVVASCLLAAGAWRLAQGPIDLGRWGDRVRAALIDDTALVHVSFDGVFLAWEGFHQGVDHPLDLRLLKITITDQAGRRLVAAPSAHLTFSFAGLLLGRIVPRAVEVDHAEISVTREANGSVNLGGAVHGSSSPDTGTTIDLTELQEQLSRPVSTDHGRTRGLFDQIQRAHFRNADVTFRDLGSGLIVRTPDMDLDLVRARTGHVRGLLGAPLSVGNEKTRLTAEANWTAGSDVKLDMRMTSLRPASMGAFPPDLAFMAGIDVPVSLTAAVEFDPAFKPKQVQTDIQLGQGQIQIGQGSIPLRSGTVAVSAKPGAITITKGHFDVAHTPQANPEIVDIAGTIAQKADRLAAAVSIGLDHVDIADLPRLWPAGVASGARPWVTEHVTGGMATRGTASFAIEADDALHDVVVTKATADLDGSGGTFTWIDNVPPIEQAEVHLHLVDPDTLDIHLASGRQRIRNGGADLLIRNGQMRITGLSVHDQDAVIRAQVEGPIASALTLLKEPRLSLLSTHPIAVKIAGGDATATLDVGFPLENKLQIDDVRLHADAHLVKVRLLDVGAGQDLNDGVFDLGVEKAGLSLKGQGSVATVPVTVNGTIDFSSGPADQIVQKISVTGQPDATQLDAAGLPVAGVVAGPVPLTIVMIARRGGDTSVAINGELTQATLAVAPLAWRKPSGAIASASAILLMSHDRLTKIDKIVVRGDGLLLAGSADFADGHIRTLLLDAIRLGRTQGHGTIHLATNEPAAIVLQGDLIDLSPKLTAKAAGGDKPDAPQVTTPGWTLAARFDHAILANDQRASDVLVKIAGGGQTIRFLDVVGRMDSGLGTVSGGTASSGTASSGTASSGTASSGTASAGTASSGTGNPGGANSGFAIKIEPQAGTRRLLVDAKDAGSFLRGLDVVKGMRSGHLLINGVFTSPFGFFPLAGTATIDDVVVTNSPALGKLLQAITLYGLVDVLRGPGMGFSRIEVPFHYDGANLQLDEAHAYNSSLGLTAQGRIGLVSGQAAITGTIVPVYFFNSMLGQLPLVGRLFSPEKGGGVFAARFGINGALDDPIISINPLSALTPGFLRQIFGVFDRPSPGGDGPPVAGK